MSPVMAIVAAIVAILVLLGAAVWVGLQPALTPPGSAAITLGQPYFSGNAATIPVAYVSTPITPGALLVSLDVNGTMGSSAPMPTVGGPTGVTTIAAVGYVFRVVWWDNDGDGALSSGDTFGLSPQSGMPGCCGYVTFYVLWKAGGLLGALVRFYAPPSGPPLISFGSVSRGTQTNVFIPITAVSPPTPAAYLLFRIQISTNASSPTPFPAFGNTAANLSFWGGEYIVVWYDTNHNELVDAGDSLNVTMVSGTWPPTGTPMAFILEWNDLTELAVATWTA